MLIQRTGHLQALGFMYGAALAYLLLLPAKAPLTSIFPNGELGIARWVLIGLLLVQLRKVWKTREAPSLTSTLLALAASAALGITHAALATGNWATELYMYNALIVVAALIAIGVNLSMSTLSDGAEGIIVLPAASQRRHALCQTISLAIALFVMALLPWEGLSMAYAVIRALFMASIAGTALLIWRKPEPLHSFVVPNMVFGTVVQLTSDRNDASLVWAVPLIAAAALLLVGSEVANKRVAKLATA